jgi:hypothetical protein
VGNAEIGVAGCVGKVCTTATSATEETGVGVGVAHAGTINKIRKINPIHCLIIDLQNTLYFVPSYHSTVETSSHHKKFPDGKFDMVQFKAQNAGNRLILSARFRNLAFQIDILGFDA